MKKAFLFLFLVGSFFADAQSLKEALYGGKLKNEPGTVIRKGDDLAAKMDTTTKKQGDELAKQSAVINADTTTRRNGLQVHTATTPLININDSTAGTVAATTTASDTAGEPSITGATEVNATPAAPKVLTVAEITRENNAQVKEYMTSIANALKAEALPNKKVKKESYLVMVSYAIETTGQMTVTDLFVSPENAFLLQQVKDRLAVDIPTLTPVPASNGTPRRVNKKYNFTLIKE